MRTPPPALATGTRWLELVCHFNVTLLSLPHNCEFEPPHHAAPISPNAKISVGRKLALIRPNSGVPNSGARSSTLPAATRDPTSRSNTGQPVPVPHSSPGLIPYGS